jgi:hypothetical protein
MAMECQLQLQNLELQCFAGITFLQRTAGAAVGDGVCTSTGRIQRGGVLWPVVVVLRLALHRIAPGARAVVVVVLAATAVASETRRLYC